MRLSDTMGEGVRRAIAALQGRIAGLGEHPDFDSEPRTSITETIPNLASTRGCEQAAKVIVDEAADPF